MESESRQDYLKLMDLLKKKDVKNNQEFTTYFVPFQEEVALKGLDDDILNKLTDNIIHTDLRSTQRILLIKCLIPRNKMPEEVVKSIITWCLSSLNKLPITVSKIVIQWVTGLWEYELVDRKIINIYYDVFFYTMVKYGRLEHDIARLIYVLTKPEDVSRRDVLRLLTLQKKYSKSPKHIIALLSLFKSYKPELVPEKIQSVNIESVWKPIPEFIRLALEDARDRAEIQQSQRTQAHLDWNIMESIKARKRKQPLLPSVGYFHIGSSIFKDKEAKSIFDITSIEELGKYHQDVELPCNAVSLLANTAGYHLLTYANFQYQSRFSYNLYNTLLRAFILENGKFSDEEMNKLLTMTIEFSRYMQEGILIMKLFLNEYLYFNTGEHLLKLLDLLQWMTSISVTELQENILMYVQNIFYESNLAMKCKIIESLRKLITNLFVRQGFEKQRHASLFLQQSPLEDLAEIIPVLTTISENLIVCGLNIHNYDIILLSEALTFYEEICTLESRSHVLLWTLPPPAVIYGGFLTRSCAMLSRVCKLLLRYRDISPHLRQIMPENIYEENVHVISIYANDIHKALWYNEPFSARKSGYLLRNLSKKIIHDLGDCDLDFLLNISNHYALLSYKYTINKTGLNITTKQDSLTMASYYCPAISQFLAAFT